MTHTHARAEPLLNLLVAFKGYLTTVCSDPSVDVKTATDVVRALKTTVKACAQLFPSSFLLPPSSIGLHTHINKIFHSLIYQELVDYYVEKLQPVMEILLALLTATSPALEIPPPNSVENQPSPLDGIPPMQFLLQPHPSVVIYWFRPTTATTKHSAQPLSM